MAESDILAERAALYHDEIMDIACGPGGILIAFPRFDTRKPFREGESYPGLWNVEETIEGAWSAYGPKPTAAEFLYGENTLWATGWFLWSQILRHRASQEPEARETARKCFRDLNYLFKLCGELEPGLLGKPHGGRAGPNTSFDQSACPVAFYAAYAQELATPEERAVATENLRQHGHYYLRRNWVLNLFGILHRIVEPPASVSVMKYLACMYAAYELTGETEFRDEVFKHLREIIPMLPFPTNPYPTCHNLYYWALLCEFWSRTEIGDEADWIGYIGEYWKAARAARDDEGLSLAGYYDTEDGSFTPYPNRWLTHEDSKSNAPWGGKWGHAPEKEGVRTWVSATNMNNRALCSAMFAALGLLARSHGLDDDAHLLARQTLMRMDADSLRWWWDDGNLPDELKGLHNIFAPEAAGVWQVAYWMGVSQGVW